MDASRVLKDLRWFAADVCRGRSPLYEHLCARIADDERLLELVCATPDGQPVPNLFLAAVQFLLFSTFEEKAADYYASCVTHPGPPDGAYAPFREFCLRREAAIRELIATRRVQTNEVGRCAYLLPAFAHLAALADPRPLALIECGTSAGLNLIWDRYAYDFGEGRTCGRSSSRVRIRSEWRGNKPSPLPNQPIQVAQRVGIDLHVVDVKDVSERMWLRSLIWPEQHDRLRLLEAAMLAAREMSLDLREGDALELLPDVVRSAPRDAHVCVYHSHMLNQFSTDQREGFGRMLADLSDERPLFQLSAEWIGTPTTELTLSQWERGECRTTHLANVDQHGQWIEWRN